MEEAKKIMNEHLKSEFEPKFRKCYKLGSWLWGIGISSCAFILFFTIYPGMYLISQAPESATELIPKVENWLYFLMGALIIMPLVMIRWFLRQLKFLNEYREMLEK